MGIVSTLRDVLVPDSDQGIELECTDCGARFDEPRGECPECGSTDVKEVEGFDMRPDD